jgi:hypothetical protein
LGSDLSAALNADKASRAALISDFLEPLIDGAVVERCPGSDRRKLQDHDSSWSPVTFIDLVRPTSCQVSSTSSFESWLHLAHEILVPLGVSDLNIENNICGHELLQYRLRSLAFARDV